MLSIKYLGDFMNLLATLLTLPYSLLLACTGVLGISLLVSIHELGHFLFAKLFKVYTPSFSIGFGPRLISKKIGSTTFCLSAIPLGGYVEVAGMAEVGQGEQKEAYDLSNKSFATKPFYQKMCILFGGILFNLLFTISVLWILFMIGAPKSDLLYPLGITKEKPIIKAIRPHSAAQEAMLQVNDEIISVNKTDINNDTELLKKTIRSLPDQKTKLQIKRDSQIISVEITPTSSSIKENGQNINIGSLGVVYEIEEVQTFGPYQALKQSLHATLIYACMVAQSFKNIFIKKDVTGIGGPVLVITETIKGAQKGLKTFLLFLAIISINLAILNLIPLPILDGGQILFVTIETIIGKQLPKLREYIHIISWIAVMGLLFYLTLKDIGLLKLFNR